MAKERIALGINLRQNKITGNAGYGKYYPEVDVQKTLSLRGFAKHMTDHGSVYGRDLLEGVLIKITECLPELVSQGIPVQLAGLGTFYPTAQVKKDAAVASIADMDGLNPNDIVEAIHIRFLPDTSKLDNISGRAFKEACALEVPQHRGHSGGDRERQVAQDADPHSYRYSCGSNPLWRCKLWFRL